MPDRKHRGDGDGESRRTVIVALAANASLTVAKLFAGLAGGSTAMLAEAAHSLADTTNQVFLLVSINLAQRRATSQRPFGYGQERFLWTFVAAIGMFTAGAAFAVGYGAYELVSGAEKEAKYLLSYAVLGFALLAEGSSWLRAVRQTRGDARDSGRTFREEVRASRDPSVKMVLFEDSAALAGIVIAAAGLALHEFTGQASFDPAASVLIGVLLMAVALFIARDARHLLTGAAARPEERARIEEVIDGFPEIEETVELLTMVLGPDALLVAARVDFRDEVSSRRVEEVSTEIDRRLRDAVPDVAEVFLDGTRRALEPR